MTAGQPLQLPLGIKLRDDATLVNFYPGPNLACVEAVARLADPARQLDESVMLLWGAQASGRSHLLQAACHQLAERDGLAMYFPLAELQQHGPSLLEGTESLDLLCLDQLDAVVGDSAWEEALFHLYNRVREQGGRLLLAADAPPRQLGLQLPDLSSRLSWGLVYQLQPLSDADKQAALIMRAERRGLQLSEDAVRYLFSRAGRSMSELFDLLEQLDQASLQAQRRLTVPFIKQVMGW
ncbi:DnaA regulatory inactivator Hda [Halopseudomonas salegens]|uniref:Regulatory inactivation of DnaA Hda protein n=1 Tax=Halopseudomonas salegens TaxID=1434072 RepID=A0A1H2G2M2_9GAMM|nr:DnaA regulatory inactivator Hda [Halopseudomonas salegens]SDU13775.1 regulatory inactivation of DnaA Hda protein [Halopseudomonas salegens]